MNFGGRTKLLGKRPNVFHMYASICLNFYSSNFHDKKEFNKTKILRTHNSMVSVIEIGGSNLIFFLGFALI